MEKINIEKFNLEQDSFFLLKYSFDNPYWCECYYTNKVLGRLVGGAVIEDTCNKFIKILKMKTNEGTENTRHKNILNSKSSYLGYVVFSGYDTFYFFKNNDYYELLILDGSGKFVAHHIVSYEIISLWKHKFMKIISQLKIRGQDSN